ncbi:MAG: DUF1045 domain-containing protein [Pseudomonadota bacterium]
MTRYAIYFVPSADTALWRFGCKAVGYDSQARADIDFHENPFYAQESARDWTADPRRYGFHATLKPPFALADGSTIEGLEKAAITFTKERQAFQMPRLKVAPIGSFLALVPEVSSQELSSLAADCVRIFEPFRAPLSAADRDRRLRSPLTEKQVENLDAWGYPYVFDDFRFHMTLSGRLPDAVQQDALAALRDLYRHVDQPVTFDPALTIRSCCSLATDRDLLEAATIFDT